jgi:hypothetical protein
MRSVGSYTSQLWGAIKGAPATLQAIKDLAQRVALLAGDVSLDIADLQRRVAALDGGTAPAPDPGDFDGLVVIKTAATGGEDIIEAGVSDAAGRWLLKNGDATGSAFSAQIETAATGDGRALTDIGTINPDPGDTSVAAFRRDARDSGGGGLDYNPIEEWCQDGQVRVLFRSDGDTGVVYLVFSASSGNGPPAGGGAGAGARILFTNTLPGSGTYAAIGINGGGPWINMVDFADEVVIYADGSERFKLKGDGNFEQVGQRIALDVNAAPIEIIVGTGNPAGAEAANEGSLYLRPGGGTGATLYVKETGGATSAGWVAK